jgi:transcription elongation factor/antiterminator RfaH
MKLTASFFIEVLMSPLWYAIRSKPNKEDFLAGQLESYGIEVFLPRIRVTPVNPRSRKMRPFFPNYLFVHVDLDTINVSTLRWMPGASGVVSFDGEPASVPDVLIVALERQVDLMNVAVHTSTHNLKSGDSVIIQAGPFAGYEAIFDANLPGRDRVRVLLNFLQARQVLVELQSGQIKRTKKHD